MNMNAALHTCSSVECSPDTLNSAAIEISAFDLSPLRGTLRRRLNAGPLELQHRQLRGDFEALGVSRVIARYCDQAGRRRVFTCVIKRVAGAAAREARVYRDPVASHVPGMAPRLLAWHEPSKGRGALSRIPPADKVVALERPIVSSGSFFPFTSRVLPLRPLCCSIHQPGGLI